METASEHIAWQTVDHVPVERTVDWYWTVGVLTAVGVGGAVFLGNWLFALLIALAGGLVIFFALRGPKTLSCEITDGGVLVNKDFFSYANLTSFCVEESGEHATLLLVVRGTIASRIALPLPHDVLPARVRAALAEHVAEVHYERTIGDVFADYLGL